MIKLLYGYTGQKFVLANSFTLNLSIEYPEIPTFIKKNLARKNNNYTYIRDLKSLILF